MDIFVSLGVALADEGTYARAHAAANVQTQSASEVSSEVAQSYQHVGTKHKAHEPAGDQLVVAHRRGTPRDLAREAAAVDAEMRRRRRLLPTHLRTYVRVDPALSLDARSASTRTVDARSKVEMATAAWLKTADAEQLYARLRTCMLATNYMLDGSGVSRRVKYKGQRQVMSIALRQRAQLPSLPVRFKVAFEPRDAVTSCKLMKTRQGATVSYELSRKAAGSILRVAVFAIVGKDSTVRDEFQLAAEEKLNLGGAAAKSAKKKKKAKVAEPEPGEVEYEAELFDALSIDELAGMTQRCLAHVSGSPFLLRMEEKKHHNVAPPHVQEMVDFCRLLPPPINDPLSANSGPAARDADSGSEEQQSHVKLAYQRLTQRLDEFGMSWHSLHQMRDESSEATHSLFAAVAAHLTEEAGSRITVESVRLMAARWLSFSPDFKLSDGRELSLRFDSGIFCFDHNCLLSINIFIFCYVLLLLLAVCLRWSEHDSWTDYVHRVGASDLASAGVSPQPGDWMCALALAEGLGARLIVVTGAEDDACVAHYWPQHVRRMQPIVLGHWGTTTWRAIQTPDDAALTKILTEAV